MDLTTLTLADASRQIAAGELSPVDLTRAHLDRIATVDRDVNAFITVTGPEALEAARVLDGTSPRGPLHGIPIALKDLYDTRGVRTTVGMSLFADRVPDTDAAVVGRLRAAGAILLGKLNMHESALGVTNDNPHFGPARNPWSLDRITGGSSGGSAAALAAGLCLVSLGSDTGGSIRIPAALCGIVGLKPTRGRVSLRGVVPLSWNLDHAGPMARRVRDAAVLFDAISGHDPDDPGSANVPTEDSLASLDSGIAGWKIGTLSDAALAGVEPAVVEAVRAAAEVFRSLGASVREVELADLAAAASANGLMTTADAAAFHHERMEQSADRFGADVLARLRRGAAVATRAYIEARHKQDVFRQRFQAPFVAGELDVIITPTVPCVAPVREGLDPVATAPMLTRFTAPFNFTGLPALSVPCGFSDGLPIGLQIVGPLWSEARVLRAGYAYEQATSWHQRTVSL